MIPSRRTVFSLSNFSYRRKTSQFCISIKRYANACSDICILLRSAIIKMYYIARPAGVPSQENVYILTTSSARKLAATIIDSLTSTPVALLLPLPQSRPPFIAEGVGQAARWALTHHSRSPNLLISVSS